MAARYQIYKFDTSSVAGSTDTLNGAINSTQTSITLTSGTTTVNGTVLSIGTEHLYIDSGGGTANLTVTRGWAGTTAASAANLATVNVPGLLSYNLLQVMSVPNQEFTFAKISTDINYVKLIPFASDTLPSSATSVILADASSNYGTTRLTAPGNGSHWLLTSGAGSVGASGGGGGGSYSFFDLVISANAVTPDLANGTRQKLTINQAARITINNPIFTGGSLVPGQPLIIFPVFDSTPGRPVPAWGTAYGQDVATQQLDTTPSTRGFVSISLQDDSLWHLEGDVRSGLPLS